VSTKAAVIEVKPFQAFNIPWPVLLEHDVEDRQQLARGSHDNEFAGEADRVAADEP
jgi:hypothetical protein